jgi:acyl-CoA thioester hydrolase
MRKTEETLMMNSKFETRVPIRFADIDAMGHVNNAIYFTYFEQARMAFFRERVGKVWDWTVDGIIVAHNEIDYKRPVLLQDDMRILLWVEKVGTKSFEVKYEVMVEDQLCATGGSVLVCFNHKSQQTQAVPAEWVKAFTN